MTRGYAKAARRRRVALVGIGAALILMGWAGMLP